MQLEILDLQTRSSGLERDLAEVAAYNLPIINNADKKALATVGRKPALTLLDLDENEVTALVQEFGQPAFRAKQIWGWLYQKFAHSYDEMTNLPSTLTQKLAERAPLAPLEVIVEKVAYDGQTRKALFRLADGAEIESVLMLYADRATV